MAQTKGKDTRLQIIQEMLTMMKSNHIQPKDFGHVGALCFGVSEIMITEPESRMKLQHLHHQKDSDAAALASQKKASQIQIDKLKKAKVTFAKTK